MNNVQIISLIVILLYFAVTAFTGIYFSRRKREKGAKQSNEEFLMAGKSLGPWMLAGTLFAANTGGASTTGVATNVLSQGLSASWYVISAGIGFVIVAYIAPYFRRSKSSTVPEIISKRYGKPSHIFTAFTSITALFMATGAQIIATASIITVVTGIGFNIAAIVSTVIVIFYTMGGGLKSVAAANVVHVFTITIGMTIAMFIIVNGDKVGGFDALFEKARTMTGADGQNLDLLSMSKLGIFTILGYIAMYSMTFPTGQEIVQTYCSAKSSKTAMVGSILAGILQSAYAIIPAIIGLTAYVCIDGYAAGGQSRTALADATIQLAPAFVAGLVLAGVVAATISSAAGNMLGTATMFTNDVFRPYIKKGVRDDKQEILVSQVVMTVAGLFGLAVALSGSNIISVMMSVFALRSAGPFVAFICGLFYKNVTQRAGFISIVVGTIVAAFWIYGLGTPWGLSAIVPGSVVALVFIFACSAFDIKKGIKPAPEIEFENI